jgi:hypothetical protein
MSRKLSVVMERDFEESVLGGNQAVNATDRNMDDLLDDIERNLPSQ